MPRRSHAGSHAPLAGSVGGRWHSPSDVSRAQQLPRDPEFEARVRASFERQRFMTHLGARLAAVTPGVVEIELPVAEELSEQHGFLHAGALLATLDSACGYAAL